MCHHIPWWSVGLLSFVEAEEAFNMNPGRDVHPKLSVKKTVVLLKILYYRIIESTCSWSTADGVDISTGWVKMISCEHLLMTKLCARWVPKCLTRKWRLVVDAKNQVKIWSSCSWSGLCLWGACDETWINHYDPETKKQSMQWKHASSPSPRKFKVQASAGQVMPCSGVLKVYCWLTICLTNWQLQESTMLTYFTNCLSQLKRSQESWPSYPYICTTVHLLAGHNVGQAAVLECGFEEICHPLYSPDMTPSDYHLFPKLKKHLRGQRFLTDDELKYAAKEWLKRQNYFILQALKKLPRSL